MSKIRADMMEFLGRKKKEGQNLLKKLMKEKGKRNLGERKNL
jgi:hypothetical protein